LKSHSFNGRKYIITVEEAPDGSCNQYNPERELAVHANMGTRNGLITAIHEGLHACSWPASEESVLQTSHDIGRFLWRLGYRIRKE